MRIHGDVVGGEMVSAAFACPGWGDKTARGQQVCYKNTQLAVSPRLMTADDVWISVYLSNCSLCTITSLSDNPRTTEDQMCVFEWAHDGKSVCMGVSKMDCVFACVCG